MILVTTISQETTGNMNTKYAGNLKIYLLCDEMDLKLWILLVVLKFAFFRKIILCYGFLTLLFRILFLCFFEES